jgi:hypothetical protein
MIKKLTLFCTFAIIMLAVGGAVTPVWAHAVCTEDGKGKHSLGHPHCDEVTGTTTDGSLYKVSVSGALILSEHFGHDGVGNKETVSVNWDYLNMNLGFLERNVDNGDGLNCFRDPVPLEGRQTVLSIGHDKTGELVAGYVFSGYGTDGVTRIGYRLKLLTDTYDSDWRPTSSDVPPRTDLVFDEWELYDNKKSDIACTGSGFFLAVVGEENTTITIILQ